jgi:hypothetical protein
MFYAGSSTPLVRAIVSVELISRYGVSSYISDILRTAGLYFFFVCFRSTMGMPHLKNTLDSFSQSQCS